MFFVLPIEEGNPVKKFPLVNLLLIALNVYVFTKTATLPQYEQVVLTYGFTPAHPDFRAVFTSMFMHGGIAHLLGNMYFLYVFGDNVESRLGKIPYLLTYLICGFGACILQYVMDPRSTIPMIGASGAISGVCALYMLMFPWQKMRLQVFFIIFPLFSIPARAVFVVGLWFLEQYFMATSSSLSMGGVAFWAHVGGFLTGILSYFFLNTSQKKINYNR